MLLNLRCAKPCWARMTRPPQPALAQRWKVSADGLAWHFTLRPGARFHDGSRATAAGGAKPAARPKAPALLSNAPIASITAEGDGEVLIRLSRPHNALAAQLAHYSTLVLAPAVWGQTARCSASSAPAPTALAKLVPPQQVETVAFDDYDRPHPPLPRRCAAWLHMAVTGPRRGR